MFLNEEKKKLKDCTDEEILIIFKSDVREHWCLDQWWDTSEQLLNRNFIYRVPVAPMQVDWSHIDKKWNHIRVDWNDEVCVYADKPHIDRTNDTWELESQEYLEIVPQVLASFIRGNLPWDQAICDRPGHE